MRCKTIGCTHLPEPDQDFCPECLSKTIERRSAGPHHPPRLADIYPQYYKDVAHLTEVDVYAVHHIFDIQDPSGAIQHASKKLLLSGVRTGGKSAAKDIKEARDTLSRWLQLNGVEG